MSRAEFIVAFDGPGIVQGRMDIRDLAPALLSLGRLLDAANLSLHGQDRPLKVEIKALSAGCFEVHIDAVLTGWHYIRSLLEAPDAQAAKTLLEWIGLLGSSSGAVVGLIGLYRWLNGKKPDRVLREKDGIFIFELEGRRLQVPFAVMRLYQDIAVNRAFGEMLNTVEGGAVDRIDFRSADADPAKPSQTLTRDDRRAFTLAEAPPETVADETRPLALSIRNLAFQEGNKWRLFDGQNTITATIEDRDFIERVNLNIERFAKGDILLCEVRTIQTQAREGLKTEHIVLKVTEHRPAQVQIALPFAASEDEDEPPSHHQHTT